MSHHEWYVWLAAVVVATVSVARTARLLVWDEFPPVRFVRDKVRVALKDSPWSKLIECAFCLSPYLSIGMIAWAWLSDLHWHWWLVNIWWGVMSYGAAILVSYDQPSDGTD